MNKILRNSIVAAIVLGTVGTSSFYNYTYAKGEDAVEEGNGAKANGKLSVAIGGLAKAQNEDSIAIGYCALAQNEYAMALGYNSIAKGEKSIAAGVNSETKGRFSVALGNATAANGYGSMALGFASHALGDHSEAFGENAAAFSKSSVAIGYGSKANDEYEFSVGKDVTNGWYEGYPEEAIYRRITHVADGVNDHDAVTVEQLNSTKLHYISTNFKGIATTDNEGKIRKDINFNNDGAKSTGSIAIGFGAKTDDAPEIYGDDPVFNGENQIAMGFDAKAYGNSAVSLGQRTFSNSYGVSIGNGAHSDVGGVSIGAGAGDDDKMIKGKQGAVIIGSGAKAQFAGSVALGTMALANRNAVTTEEGKKAAFLGDTESVRNTFIQGKRMAKEPDLLAINLNAAVSIGRVDDSEYKHTRQLTGLAAGTEDTDAVNVAQAKALVSGEIDAANTTRSVTGAKIKAELDKKTNVDLDNLTTAGTNKVKTLAGEQITATVTEDFVTEKVKKGNVSSTTLDVTGTGKLVDSDLTIDLKDGSVTKEKLANDLKTEIEGKANTSDLNKYVKNTDLSSYAKNTELAKKANVDLDNLTTAGTNKVKTLAGEQITATVTQDFVTEKVKKGNVSSTTLDVTGTGKLVDSDLTIDLKDGSVTKEKLANDLKTEIEGKANATDLNAYAKTDATNITGESLTKWQSALGNGTIAENDKGLVTGGTVHTALQGKADKSELSDYAKNTELATKANADLDNLTTAGTNKVKTLAGEQITATVTQDFVTEKVKKGNLTSDTLDVKGDGKLVGSDLKIDLKDGSVTKGKLANDLKTEIEGKANTSDLNKYVKNTDLSSYAKNTELAKKANVDLDNLTTAGTSKVKSLAGEQITATVTQDFVTEKVKKGSVSSTTLDVTGNGKLVDSDLTIDLKDGSITKGKLSNDLKTEIENKANTSDLNNYVKNTDLSSYAKTSDLNAYAKNTELAKKADTNASNLTKAEDILAWQKKLGLADNSATVTPGSTATTTNLFTTVNQLKAGYTVKAGTDTFDMKLGDTTAPTIEFAGDSTNGLDVAADKAGKKITYAINKDKLVKYIAGDLIKQMNGEGTPGSGDHGTPGSGNPSGHGTGEQGQTTPLPVLTNVSTGFNIAVGSDSKNFTFGKGKETNKLTFAGTNDETSVSISGEDGTPTITVGLADTFKTKVENKADKSELSSYAKISDLSSYAKNTELAKKANVDLDNLTTAGTSKVKSLAGEQITATVTQDFVTEKVKKGTLTSDTLNVTGNGKVVDSDLKIDLKDGSVTKGKLSSDLQTEIGNKANASDLNKYVKNTDLSSYAKNTELAKKANVDLDNLTTAGTSKVKSLAGEQITATVTQDFVTEKVKKGNLTSDTLDVTGTGKLVGSDLKIDLKDGSVTKGKLANDLKTEIEGKANTSDLSSYAKTSDLNAYAKNTELAKKADTNASNLTKAEDILAWQKKLGLADNSATVTPGSTATTTNLYTTVNNMNTTVNQLKAGYTVKAGTNTFDMKLGDTTAPTIEFAGDSTNGLDVAADKAGKKITYAINKDKLVKYIAGDLIKQMNGEGTPGSGDPSGHGTGEQGQTTPLPVLTNVSTGFNIAVGTDSKNFTFGKGKETNKLTFAETKDETVISLTGEDGTPTVTVGLADAFKTKVENKADKSELSSYAKNSALKELETKVNNITGGTTNIEGSNIDLSTNNTFKELKTSVEGKANADGSNVTTPSTWATKLGTGEVATGNANLVTGGKVFDAIKDKADKSDLSSYAKTSDLSDYAKSTELAKKANVDLDNLTDTGTNKVKTLAGEQIAATVTENFVTEKVKKGTLTSDTLDVTGTGKLVDSDLIIDLKDGSVTKGKLANDLKTEIEGKANTSDLNNYVKNTDLSSYAKSTELAKKANVDLDNLTTAGTNKVKTLAGEQITATVTQDFVTEKVKKGALTSDTLDVTGTGKLVDSDLKIDLKDGSITKGKLSNDLKTEIEGKANASDLNKYVKNTDLSSYAKTSDLNAYAKNTELATKADKNAENIEVLAWQKKLGLADNSATVTPGSTTTTNLFTTVNQLKAGYTVKAGTNTFDMKLGDTAAPTIEFAGDSTNGLDVAADKAGKKITYAINKDKLVKSIAGDLIKQMNGEGTPGSGDHGTPGSGNPSGHGTGEQGQTTPLPVLTNVSTGFNIAVGNDSKNFTFGKGKETNKLTFAGTNDETVISLTGEDGTPTVTVGLADTFKTKVNNKADKDELKKLETKVNNITGGTTNIEGSNIDLSTNNTFKTLQNKVEGKANADGSNVTTPATWATKLGTGEVATGNANLVTGGKVFDAIKDKADKSDLSSYAKTSDLNAYAKNTELAKKANVDLDNLTDTGTSKVKTLAGEQITATVTQDFVTEKVKKGNVSSTTLDVTGNGKLVDSDLTIDLKDGSVTKGKLSNDLKTEIENKANTSDLNNYVKNTDLSSYAKTSDLNAYAKNTELAKKANTNASNLTKAEDILAWQKKLGLADNSATVTPGSTATTNLYTTVNNMNTTVNQLKAGYTVKAGTNTFDMKLGDTTAPTIEFAGDSTNGLDVAADKAGKKITYAINKDKLVKYIAGDLIKQMNGEGTPGSGDHGTPGSGNPSGHGTGEQGQTTPLPVLINVSTGFNIAVGDNSKNFTFGKGKETNKLTFAGTNDETSVSISGEDGTPTITVGLADTFKTKVNNKADKSELSSYAKNSALKELETKVNNITDGTTKIDLTNIDLSTNNTFKTLKTSLEGKANADGSNVTTPATWAEKLGTGTVAENNKELVTGGTVHTALQGKADTNASNLTKAEDILAWKKKLGLVDAQATQDSTTNISTQITGINNDITNLKGGFIVSAGTKSKEITLGGTTKDKLTFASADKNLTATFDDTKKTISYGVNVANLIGDINKSSTKITNVDLTNNQTITNLKTEIQNITNNGTTSMNGINFYLGGTSSGTTYTPSAKAEDKWQSSRIVFGEGLKAEKLKDAGNIEYTKISATGGGQGGKSAYEIWRDHKDDKGLTPNSNKSETEFLDSLKGQSGIKGADGKDGKSAYEVWRDYKEGNDSQPNKGKSEKDFMNYMKGKDCSADIQHIADNVTKGLSAMDGRMNSISAGAAALSALRPISNEYDPDDKLDFSVGFGHYRGENAVAIGAYYRPNPNMMVSLGGAFNGYDNLLNAGLSWKLGKGNEVAMLSKKVLLNEVIRLTKINKEMAAKIELQEEKIAHQESMISEQDARLKKIESLLAVK